MGLVTLKGLYVFYVVGDVSYLSLSPSLSLSSRAVVDQHTRPQVHARLHGLVTPPRVRWSSFQSASRYIPCSLVEDGHDLLCRELADIVRILACGECVFRSM